MIGVKNLTTYQGKLTIGNPKVIVFVVNDGVNIITNNIYILDPIKMFLCPKYLLYSSEVLLDKCREYAKQI